MYSKEIEPKCANCQKASKLIHTELEVVCEVFGVMPYNHWCKKYKYDIFSKKVKRRKTVAGKHKAEDFRID